MNTTSVDLKALTDDELAERYAADEDLAAEILREMARRDRKARQHARDAARWAATYDEWHAGAYAQYLAAEAECRGNLVHKSALDDVTDPFSLWTGSEAWATRCASEELKDFWMLHPRVTVSQFQAGKRADKRAAREAARVA
jgi:hypothetical protein